MIAERGRRRGWGGKRGGESLLEYGVSVIIVSNPDSLSYCHDIIGLYANVQKSTSYRRFQVDISRLGLTDCKQEGTGYILEVDLKCVFS